MTITEKLDRAYEETLEQVSDAENGSEEAKWQMIKLSELHKQRMAVKQLDIEKLARVCQNEEAKKDRTVKIVLDGAMIIVTCLGMAASLIFEATGGAHMSRTGQWLSSHIKLFKR